MMLLTLVLILSGISLAEAAQPVSALAPFDTYADGFHDLRGIALDAAGAVFVADRDAGTVTRIGADLARTVIASGLERPIGLAFDPDGRLLVAEERAGRVVRIEFQGAPTPLLTDVKQPRWLALRDDGTLYVAARALTRGADAEPDDESAEPEMILALTADGRRAVFSDGFRDLQGLVANHESVWAVSRGRQGENSAAGVVYRIAILDGGAGSSATPLSGAAVEKPVGLARDRLGALWLTAKELSLAEDKSKRVVAKLDASGGITLFALNLDDPKGLAFGREGHLYVADGASGRVVRFRAPAAPTLRMPSLTRESAITVTGTTEPDARVEIFVEGAPTAVATVTADSTGAFSAPVALRPNAASALTVFATAHGGHGLSSPPAEAIVIHDDIGPTLALLTPPAGSHVRAQIGVAARADDAGSWVASLVLTVDAQNLATTLTPPAPAATLAATATWDTATVLDGAHTLAATAADQAGNMTTAPRVIVVDNTPPETIITAGPAQGAEVGTDAVTFGFAGSDNLTPSTGLLFSSRLDGGLWSAFDSATTTSLAGLAEGAHVFEVRARDLAGNEDPTPARWSFSVRLGPAIASVAPDAGPVGTLVTITGANFVPGATSVMFNGLGAAVRTVTTTEITTSVPLGATGGPLTVTTMVGSVGHPFTVTLTGDFTLTAVPATARVIAGDRTSLSIGAGGRGAFTSLVTLSVPTVPAGMSASLSPSPYVAPGAGAVLELAVPRMLGAGTYGVTVIGEAQVDGHSITRTAGVNLDVLPADTTAITGRVLTADAVPQAIPGVTVTLGSAFTLTDAGGNFVLLGPPAGPNMLLVDGRTASTPTAQYPPVEVQIDVAASGPTRVPFALYLPVLDTVHPVSLPLDGSGFTTAEVKATTPLIPGLVVTIPQGTRIVGPDGNPVAQVTITPVPVDRSPMPFPPGVTAPMLFTIQPGGAVPSQPLPISFPNVQNAPPGSVADLHFFDLATGAWAVWGTGTVSDDRRQIVSDPGVGLPRFAWHFAYSLVSLSDQVRTREPGRATAGEPVDLPTGRFVAQQTDLVLPGRIPVAIQRMYRSENSAVGLFGVGWTLDLYDTRLTTAGTSMSLVLPDQSTSLFAPSGPGQWTNAQQTFLRGAVLTQLPGDFRFQLRSKDGTVHRFERLLGFADAAVLAAITDRNGNTVTISRVPQSFLNHRITAITEPAGRAFTLGYDASGRITTVTDPIGRQALYAYDALGRLETVTDPAGGITRYTYDASHRIATITDPRNIAFLRNEYDANGRVIRQTQPDGGVWEFAYGLNGTLVTQTTVTDPRGSPTTYRFSSQGFTLSTTDALGQTTSFEYGPGSNLLQATTDPLGRVTRYEYDAAGNVTRLVDPAQQPWAFTYEPTFNQVSTITDPLAHVTRLEYDAQGNLRVLEYPLTHRTTLDYNASGQVTRITDPLQHPTAFTYDADGNLVTITDALGNTTVRRWDPVSRLLAQTDPRGRTTTFAYDGLNRVARIQDARGGLTDFTYDGNGNLLTVTDAREHTTRYTYDAMDRVETRTDPVQATETFAYDGVGNLIHHTDRKQQPATFSYDALNRRTGAVYVDATTSVTHDAVGRVIRTSDSAGGTLQNIYDPLDRLLAQSTPLGTLSYEYDALGRRTLMAVPGQPVTTYAYDDASRLTSITRGSQAVGLEYDDANRRALLTLPNQVSTEYQYDAASRLTALIYRSATGQLGELTYQYDPAGNRTRIGGSFARTLLPDAVASATYDAANRQLTFGSLILSYDANGNLVGDGPATYTWDARDRLVTVDGPGTVTSVQYDPLGRRNRTAINGTESRSVYDGPNPVQQLDGAGGVATLLTGLRIDEHFARTDAAGSRILITDSLGSTLAEADASGTVQAQFTYEAFGKTGVAGTTSNPIRFTAREHESALGLYDYRARWYSPRTHRFLSEDPIGFLGGINSYRYVDNNPLSHLDPFGLKTTVYYYPPGVHGGFQHNAIQVGSGPAYGFYPKREFREQSCCEVVPGEIRRDDPRGAWSRREIDTSPEQEARISDFLQRHLQVQSLGVLLPYQAVGFGARNCAIFVSAALQAGGLQVPTVRVPEFLMLFGVPRNSPAYSVLPSLMP